MSFPYLDLLSACLIRLASTAREVSKYGVFSGPYFPVLGPEKTPYLDTFYTVINVLVMPNLTFLG